MKTESGLPAVDLDLLEALEKRFTAPPIRPTTEPPEIYFNAGVASVLGFLRDIYEEQNKETPDVRRSVRGASQAPSGGDPTASPQSISFRR